MRYVDLAALRLPDDLKQRLEEASRDLLTKQTGAERKDCIDKQSNLWREIKPYLAALTGNRHNDFKCWYCEAKDVRSDYHVDHFRPKNRVKNKDADEEEGYWWLAFDYRNYRLACQYCNSPHTGEDKKTRGKWDQFPLEVGSPKANEPADNLDDERPLLLDPCRISDPLFLAFDDEGMMRPRYESQPLAKQKAEITIDVLNLNDIRVKEKRQVLWKKCIGLVAEGNKQLGFYLNGSPAAKEKFEKICINIQELADKRAEFSAMVSFCFKGTGEDWVLSLL